MRLVIDTALAAGVYELTPLGVPLPIPPDPVPGPIPPLPGDALVVTWASSQTWHIPMPCTQTLVFVLDVPAGAKPGLYPNQFNFAEYQGPATTRQAMLSRVAGSFDLGDAIEQQQGAQVSLPVLVGVNVAPGGRYFINVRNWSTDLDGFSCTPGTTLGSIASWITSP